MRNTARITKSTESNIDVIIPAAGVGKRMKSSKPKPMLAMPNGGTIFLRQLNSIQKYLDYRNIVLVTGFKNDVINIRSSDVKIVSHNEYENTNVIYSIKKGLSFINNPQRLLIILGDLAFDDDLDLGEFQKNSGSSLLIDSLNTMGEKEIGCNIIDNKITYLMWSFQQKWAQMLYLTGHELALFRSILSLDRYDKFYLFEIINLIIDMGGSFSPIYCKYPIIDIDTYKDYKIAKEYFK